MKIKEHTEFNDTYDRSRIKQLKFFTKPDTVYARMFVVSLVVLACFLSDLYVIKVRWNLVQMESALFVWCCAATCAEALNIPLSIAGIVLKRYHQGMCGKTENNLTMALAIGIFAAAYVCNFAFTWVTRDLIFAVGSASTLVDNAAAASESGEHAGVLVAAFYSAIMPLLTSMTAFTLSYFAYSPVDTMINNTKRVKISIEKNIKKINVGLAELKDPKTFSEGLIKAENDQYELEMRRLDEENQLFKQELAVLLAGMMKTPAQNGAVAKSSRELFEKHKNNQKPLNQQLPDYLMKYLELNAYGQIIGMKSAENAA